MAVTTDTSPPDTDATSRPDVPSVREPEYALWAILAGLAVLVVLDALVLLYFHHDADTAVAIIGAVDGPIAVLVSAYFGMKTGTAAGTASRVDAEQARVAANQQTLAMAAQMPPEAARPVLRKLGIPVADD